MGSHASASAARDPEKGVVPDDSEDLDAEYHPEMLRSISVDGAAAAVKVSTKNEEQTDQNPNAVGWEGPDDPNNPMNWPEWRKWSNIGALSVMTILT